MTFLKNKITRSLLSRKSISLFGLPNFEIPESSTRLIFGDSVFLRVARNDACNQSLAEMLMESSTNTYVYAYSALALSHYLVMLNCFCERVRRLERILIPINYRSFSRQWETNLDWQYLDFIKNLNLSSGSSNINISEIFENQNYVKARAHYYYYGEKENKFFLQAINNKSEGLDIILEKRKKIFAFNYLFNKEILISSKRLHALDLIGEIFSEISNKIYYIILPINIEGIDFLFGEEVRAHIKSNINFIIDRLHSKNSQVIDCSFDLSRFSFFNELDATEHLNEHGRKQLKNQVMEFFC
jgi:hypothetical protein